jgi:hypothetical protein
MGKAKKEGKGGKEGGKKEASSKKDASSAKGASSKDGKPASEAPAEENMAAEEVLYQQSLESRLEGLKLRCDALREENASLKRGAAKGEKDTHEFVAYFQSEIEKKDQLIAKLSEKSLRMEMDFEREGKRVAEESAAKVSAAQREASETMARAEGRVRVLEDELVVLAEYKHKRDALNGKLAECERALKESAERHRSETADLERSFIEKTARLQTEVEKRIEAIRRQAREEAQQGLDADTRKVIADNRRMSEELRFQLQTSDELQSQGRLLAEENKRLKRNLSLAAENDSEQAKRAHYKESEAQVLKSKIKTMERTLAMTVRDFEHSRAAATAAAERDKEELAMEVSGLRQLLKLKNKELRTVRSLAQVILDQRTEVEQFFLEALESVKSEVRKRAEDSAKNQQDEYRRQMRAAQAGQASRFPPVKAPHQLGPQPHAPSGDRQHPLPPPRGVKIELRDMSWEDREKVLQLLFARINAVDNQSHDVLRDVAVGEAAAAAATTTTTATTGAATTATTAAAIPGAGAGAPAHGRGSSLVPYNFDYLELGEAL